MDVTSTGIVCKAMRLAIVTKGLSVNGEEKGAKDKAEGGGISKGDLEGIALKVGGKPRKCGVLEATRVGSRQLCPLLCPLPKLSPFHPTRWGTLLPSLDF